MRLFVFSDTHNDIIAVRRLAAQATASAVDAILVAGDIGTAGEIDMTMVDVLGSLSIPIVAVPGNNDQDAYAVAVRRGRFIDADGRLVRLADDVVVAGWGLTAMIPEVTGPPERQEHDPLLQLVTDQLDASPAAHRVLLVHLPPAGTRAAN